MVPGRRFSTTTSAVRASRRNTSLPAAALRSRTTDRLLRLSRTNGELSPPTNGPAKRTWSPPSGCSILITSAPRSASCMPQNGPAMKLPTSRTRTPASGPAISGQLGHDERQVPAPGVDIAVPRARDHDVVLGHPPGLFAGHGQDGDLQPERPWPPAQQPLGLVDHLPLDVGAVRVGGAADELLLAFPEPGLGVRVVACDQLAQLGAAP